MRLFAAAACVLLLIVNDQTPLAVALLATAAVLAAVSWALQPLIERWERSLDR
jgi:hypothetical protein